jgi:hypothetical protein
MRLRSITSGACKVHVLQAQCRTQSVSACSFGMTCCWFIHVYSTAQAAAAKLLGLSDFPAQALQACSFPAPFSHRQPAFDSRYVEQFKIDL